MEDLWLDDPSACSGAAHRCALTVVGERRFCAAWRSMAQHRAATEKTAGVVGVVNVTRINRLVDDNG